MAKDKFIDSKLVNIRNRLMDDKKNNGSVVDNGDASSAKKPDLPSKSSGINDRDWKKAVFKRWDECKALRRDVILKLNEVLSSIPEDIVSSEKRISQLKESEEKLKKILSEIEGIDDSGWDRHNLSAELAAAMRKVENARMDCMLISAKFAEKPVNIMQNPTGSSSNSWIHEINSLTFKQGAKLGFGIFFPLIIGIIIGVLILSLFNYLAVN